MEKIVIIFLMVFITMDASAQQANPDYDAELAQELGADDYGMKSYVLVILKTGSNVDVDSELRTESFNGHMKNMSKLVEDNKLVVAGPIEKNDNDYRGIFILNVKTKEEAEELLLTDPAIKNKYLEADLYNWYGSAALPKYLDASERVGKYKM